MITADQVRAIVREEIKIGKVFLDIHPRVNAKTAMQILGCCRQTLYNNSRQLGGLVINRRNEMDFDTQKVIEYKYRFLKTG